MVIAIDGPSGVGKSTVARRVAHDLGIPYLDTGATYRAATLAAMQSDVPIGDEAAVLRVVQDSRIDYGPDGVMLDDASVAQEVRTDEVTSTVSAVSAHPSVRSEIVEIQRRWVADRGGDAVVEGRDIGTVVFPDAAVKIYLTASPLVRAQRRAKDSEAGGQNIAEIAEKLAARDHADSTRKASPLKPADDATMIDTSDMSIDEVVAAVVQQVVEAEGANTMPSNIDDHGRPEPDPTAGEVEGLRGFLDYQRATLEWKTRGLDDEALKATTAESSMTLGGLLKHMTFVEEYWFAYRLHGNRPSPPWDTVDWEADNDWDWNSAADNTPDELRAMWTEAVGRSRDLVTAVLDDGGLDQPAATPWPSGESPNLRWIMLHMIEEYARHNGHADLLREAIDGETGE